MRQTVREGLVAKVAREARRVVPPPEDGDHRVAAAERCAARAARCRLHLSPSGHNRWGVTLSRSSCVKTWVGFRPFSLRLLSDASPSLSVRAWPAGHWCGDERPSPVRRRQHHQHRAPHAPARGPHRTRPRHRRRAVGAGRPPTPQRRTRRRGRGRRGCARCRFPGVRHGRVPLRPHARCAHTPAALCPCPCSSSRECACSCCCCSGSCSTGVARMPVGAHAAHATRVFRCAGRKHRRGAPRARGQHTQGRARGAPRRTAAVPLGTFLIAYHASHRPPPPRDRQRERRPRGPPPRRVRRPARPRRLPARCRLAVPLALTLTVALAALVAVAVAPAVSCHGHGRTRG